MDSNDYLLIHRIQNGDEAAFELVFSKYYVRLCTFSFRFTSHMPVSEEIVSEVFLYLWENREDLVVSVSLKSYLFKMVQNRSLNYLKHLSIENVYIRQVEKQFLAHQNSGYEEPVYFSDKIIEIELELEIEKAIESLPEKCREIFKMSRCDQLKYTEISQKLNLSIKTVERQMGIALDKLREKLKDYLMIFF